MSYKDSPEKQNQEILSQKSQMIKSYGAHAGNINTLKLQEIVAVSKRSEYGIISSKSLSCFYLMS